MYARVELDASKGNELQNQSFYFRRFTAFGNLNKPEESLTDMEKVGAFPSTEPTTE